MGFDDEDATGTHNACTQFIHKHHNSSSACTCAANIQNFWKPLFKAQPPLSEAAKLFLLDCLNATSFNPSEEVVEPFGPPPKRVRRPLRVLEGHKHDKINRTQARP